MAAKLRRPLLEMGEDASPTVETAAAAEIVPRFRPPLGKRFALPTVSTT